MLHKSRLLALVTLLALTILLPLAHGNPPLYDAPWRGYDTGIFPAGFAPKSITTGDLDSDGDTDVVVGNWYFAGAGISVLKNLGDGSYGPPLRYGVPFNRSVNDVGLLDIDADGDLDVVATYADIIGTVGFVALWRNDGAGLFGTRTDFTTDDGGSGLVIRDFNGDSFPDVVSANYYADNVSLLKHNGLAGPSASFLPAIHFVAGNNAEHVDAADLDNDGDVDLVVGGVDSVIGPDGLTYSPGIHTLLSNNGTGTFTKTNTYIVTEPPIRAGATIAVLRDLNNDGKLDLIGAGARAFGSIDNGVISVRNGNGNGTFAAAVEYKLPDFVFTPSELRAADLNGDGFQDLIATTPSGRANDGYNVLLNNTVGGFATSVFYPASNQTYDAATVDAEGDGDLDVITVAESSAAITVHDNPGGGIFARPLQYFVGQISEAMESADIDNDGDLDLVTNDDVVRVLKNNGDGTFSSLIYFPPGNYADLKLRDLNGDGFVDLLLGPDAEHPPYNFATALNKGNGTFNVGVVKQVLSCGEGSIDAADLDGDGDLDVILTEEQGCAGGAQPRIFLFRSDGPQVFFAMPPIVPGGFAIGIAVGDATGDGKNDLITSLAGGIGVFPGNGNVTFGPAIVSSTAPYAFQIADLNLDGKIDVGLIVPQPSFGTVYAATALGNGNGTFQAARQQSGSSSFEPGFLISHDIDIADLDADSLPDVVVTNDASNDLSVFVNSGDGSLLPQQRYGAGYAAFFSSLGDFTSDGVSDIAVLYSLPPSGLQDVVAILKGRSSSPANQPPTVAITKPVEGARLRASRPIQVVASAADADGSIARVDFLVDGVVFGSATVPPYRATLTATVRSTPYVLTARAVDNQGAETTSAPISIRVRN